ncbi:SMC-Scp complex subunit ScpB [Stieleria varia]|nr:SMC-Scp complex subunit ScpB [Stieleria varia]
MAKSAPESDDKNESPAEENSSDSEPDFDDPYADVAYSEESATDGQSLELGEFSLDDLGAAYARAAAAHDPESFVAPPELEPAEEGEEVENASDLVDDVGMGVTPEGIVEAALFVGHPENKLFNAARLASLMRDVTEEEVIEIIQTLNESYRQAGQALRIVEEETGYRMTIAPAAESIRQSFLGKVREARLSHGAIEVLSLVAYQPGITAQKVQDQRGQESGSLLNQMVRRRLLELKRETPAEGGRKVPHYYVTERFLILFGLDSLDDLPQVEESLWEG